MPETFVTMPASSTDTDAGADEYAPGSHPWNGTRPPLTNSPQVKAPMAIFATKPLSFDFRAAATVSNDVPPATSSSKPTDSSIIRVATALAIRYLNALQANFFLRSEAMRMNEQTDVTSRNT